MSKRIFLVVLLFSCIIYSNNREISTDLKGDFAIEKYRGYTEFSGTTMYGETGDPNLPVKMGTFLLPSDADVNSVSLAIEGLQESVVQGPVAIKPLEPARTCDGKVIMPENKTIVDGKNVAVYGQDKFFPSSYVDVEATLVGALANYKIVKYMVYLAKYNPVSNTLKRLDAGKLVVNYESVKGYNKAKSAAYKITPYSKKMISILAENADQFLAEYSAEFTFTNKPVYAIMTTSEVKNGLSKFNALVESKKNKGYDVKVFTDSDWGGGTGSRAADNIREWLVDNYKTMGISHVLFIGNPNPSGSKVAMKVVNTGQKPPTDFYFGELSSGSNFMRRSDHVADVCTGRLCVHSSSDYTAIDKCIEKIIEYENKPKSEIGWRKRAVLAAKGWSSNSMCSDLFNEVYNKFAKPKNWEVYRIYSNNEGNPDESSCSQTRVTRAWNSFKPGFLPWATHGSKTSSSGIMNTRGVDDLEHKDKPTIAFMGACLNASPTTSGNLSQTYFKKHGIASVANTVSSYYRPGQSSFAGSMYQAGAIYGYCKGIIDQQLAAGEAVDYMKAQGASRKDCWNNTCSHNIYGCPDVGIESCGGGTPIDVFNNTFSTRSSSTVMLKKNMLYINDLTAGATVSIVNSAGATIKSYSAAKQTMTLSTNNLSSGFYFCVVKMNNAVSKYKFIKL